LEATSVALLLLSLEEEASLAGLTWLSEGLLLPPFEVSVLFVVLSLPLEVPLPVAGLLFSFDALVSFEGVLLPAAGLMECPKPPMLFLTFTQSPLHS